MLLCPFFCSGSLKIWYVCSLVISCSLKSAINYNFNTLKSLVKKSQTSYFLPRLAPLLMMNFFGQLPSIILTQYDIFEFRDDWIYLLLYPLISIFRREFCSPVAAAAASVEFLMHCVLYQMVWVSIYILISKCPLLVTFFRNFLKLPSTDLIEIFSIVTTIKMEENC